jgi:restriction endonuclease Mrr
MKKLLFVILLILFVSGCSKKIYDYHLDYYVTVDNMNADRIYEGTKRWMAMNFVSSKAVIEYDNVEEGTLIGNGVYSKYSMIYGGKCYVGFKIRIDVKDEKFRMILSDFYYTTKYEDRVPLVKEKHLKYAEAYLNKLHMDLFDFLTTGVETAEAW